MTKWYFPRLTERTSDNYDKLFIGSSSGLTHQENSNNMNTLQAFRTAYILAFSALLAACTSSEVPTEVVQEVTLSETPAPTAPPVVSETYEKLKALLTTRGYEGIGLEFENETMWELLFKTFSDPKTANRQLKAIYTGASNSYDPKAQSLTIGKSTNPIEILSFIRKSIPLKRAK